MTNEELESAIVKAWTLYTKTAPSAPLYEATVEHYKALLKVQLGRAQQGDDTDE